MFLQNTYVI